MIELVRGPQDCKKSHLSAFDIEERVRDIKGVLDVSGADGGNLEATEYAEVVLNSIYKGRKCIDEIKSEVERLLGSNVKYVWDTPKTTKDNSKQQPLTKYS